MRVFRNFGKRRSQLEVGGPNPVQQVAAALDLIAATNQLFSIIAGSSSLMAIGVAQTGVAWGVVMESPGVATIVTALAHGIDLVAGSAHSASIALLGAVAYVLTAALSLDPDRPTSLVGFATSLIQLLAILAGCAALEMVGAALVMFTSLQALVPVRRAFGAGWFRRVPARRFRGSAALILPARIAARACSLIIQPAIQALQNGLSVQEMARGQFWIHPAMAEVLENALLGLDVDWTGVV